MTNQYPDDDADADADAVAKIWALLCTPLPQPFHTTTYIVQAEVHG